MSKSTAYTRMNLEALEAATRKFDEPFVVDEPRPLTLQERKQWNRIKRKRGRPKVGRGFQRISVSIERGLLKRVNALAEKRGVSRSKLLAQALEDALARSRS